MANAHDHLHGREDRHDSADHGRPHNHGGPGHGHAKNAGERRLRVALALLVSFTIVEAVGGLWANSIALLAEAAHMLADSASLVLAIIAIRVGQRPASAERTYGNRRYQTLAAYTNGLTLLALTVWVVVEAVPRLASPPAVNGGLMLAIAATGGLANLAAFTVLSGADSLNERGARAHILGDLLGSAAAMTAAGVILGFGWLSADPLLSLGVSVLIFRSGWQLTRESAHVLLEGTPGTFDAAEVQVELTSLAGVAGIHHVHAWSLTGEAAIVTLHADLSEGADRQQTLGAIVERLRLRFGVEHATVQIEEGECAASSDPDNCHAPSGAEISPRRL
jgi:cobalt-zinc-cadmium efflux system protein